MSPFVGVEVAQRGDRAPPPSKIGEVQMGERDRGGAEVKGRSGEYRGGREKIALEVFVPSMEGIQSAVIVTVKIGRIALKHGWL